MEQQQLSQVVKVIGAIAEAIRELGSVPSGHLYARVMGHMDLQQYEKIIEILKGAGLVRETNHELFWIGPEILKDK